MGYSVRKEKDYGVTYRRGDRVISVSYDTRDVPPFLLIGVGLSDPDGRTSTTGLWRGLDEGRDELNYSRWDFSTEGELREVLARLVGDVLPDAVALLGNEERLRALLDEQDREDEEHRQEHIRSQELAAARRAFEAGRLAEARDNYVLIGEDELSAGDRRRLYVARKNLASQPPHFLKRLFRSRSRSVYRRRLPIGRDEPGVARRRHRRRRKPRKRRRKPRTDRRQRLRPRGDSRRPSSGRRRRRRRRPARRASARRQPSPRERRLRPRDTVFECSVCGQPWEEWYEATGHGERPMVRKLSPVEAGD